MPATDADVLIVGGGPVGVGLALELGLRGIRCTVVERHATPQPIPKGQNLTQRTMEHFHFWGVEKQVRAARTIPPEHGIGGLTAYGTLLGDYSYDWLQRELVKPYYFVDNERLPQYATEAALRRRVAEVPAVHALLGWTAEDISQNENGVRVTVRERSSDDHRVLAARFAVGCDGARSLVREMSGIPQTRTDHDRLMVLLVFKSRELHRLLERYPGKSYYNVLQPELRGYWKFFGRVDLGNTWFFHAPVPPQTTADNFDFKAYLREAVGTPFEIDIEYIGFWDLRFAIAKQYRQGRVFIAGDAAHSHPPYGGYGVNSGLEDARNIGWKLAAVLQGWGGEGLLDSYDAERRPVFESTARDFIAKSIETDRAFLDGFDPARDRAAFEEAWNARARGAVGEVQSFEPNYEGSGIIWPGASPGAACSARGSHRFEARAGHHLAPAVLASGRNVYEALGTGFTLLARGAGPGQLEAFRTHAAALGVPLTILIDEVESDTRRYAADWVLIRPDQFVAWRASTPELATQDVRHVLESVSGRSPSRRTPTP